MLDRRTFLKAAAAASLAPALARCKSDLAWKPEAVALTGESPIAVLQAAGYAGGLTDAVLRGLRLCSMDARGKRVVLKPNLVEFDPAGVINTHPALIGAAIEAFRIQGAAEVIVAEGPGHRRDNEYLLDASGLRSMLGETGARYVDLNTDSVRRVELRSRFTDLGSLYLPETVLDADLLVSMPKMKTHKWAGVTLSMKNMFGIVPGVVYGWPKNVLHWAGLEGSIVDINAALAVPRFNIVDGIVGMDGNGPIQGEARHSGVLVFGADPVATDASCARLMGIDAGRIVHLRDAAAFLGNVEEEKIRQVGESIDSLRQEYRVLGKFQYLRAA